MLLAVQVAKQLTALRGPVVMAMAPAGGALAAVVYARASWPRLWLRYLAPAPLVFELLSPVLQAGPAGAPGGPRQASGGGRWAAAAAGHDPYSTSSRSAPC